MSVSLKTIRSGIQGFRRDHKGSVATIFALAFVPVAFLSLVMIDFSRASTARTNMQQTLDASTLLAARSTAITDPQLQTVGSNSFNAQIATNLGLTVLTDTYASGANNTVVADATGTVAPLVAGMFLGGPIQVAAHSEVVRSMNRLEIAMVLDTTGSMAGSKISNLQTAADNFIDTMASAAAKSSITNPVKISIVPFSSTAASSTFAAGPMLTFRIVFTPRTNAPAPIMPRSDFNFATRAAIMASQQHPQQLQ